MAEYGPRGKSYKRVARTHAIRPERWPLVEKSIRVTSAPVRLDRQVQKKPPKGPAHPW